VRKVQKTGKTDKDTDKDQEGLIMEDKSEITLEATPEQLRYAAILEKGMYIGLLLLIITFIIYISGIMRPYIPLDKISGYWHRGVHDYLEATGIGSGWSWLGMLNYGDFINFVPVAVLAGITIICFLSVFPMLLKNKDKIYALFALLEAVILTLAASGILAVGH
jgi:hypothetical protein